MNKLLDTDKYLCTLLIPEEFRFDSWQEQEIFLFSEASSPTLKPTQFPA
jgi:hypothetical protein